MSTAQIYPINIQNIKEKVLKKTKSKDLLPLEFGMSSNVKKITDEFGEILTRIDGTIPTDIEIKKGQRFLFISYDQSRFSHGIHKYPAKFFPELPRWLIQRYSKPNDLILDPFGGSGTTNVEALLCGRNSVAIDVDIFAKFLTKVKTTPLNSDELFKVVENILDKLILFDKNKINKNDIPEFPYRDNWFTEDILFELAYIKKIILNSTKNQDIKDFCLITMSSIIRAVSNADDNCTRTVVRKKLNKKIYPSFALTKFAENLILYSYNINEFSNQISNKNYVEIPNNCDARYNEYPDDSFDLAITSPPYVNAVDYPRTHQLEMYWLDMIEGSLSQLKEKHVGTEVVKAIDYKELHKIGDKEADAIIEKIYQIDKRRAYIAYKYLYDMLLNMKEVYRTLKKGGRYIIVVGNNTIRGEIFESWKYLMNLSKTIGFEIETYFGSEIIKHFIKIPRKERINTDWVIILRK